MTTHRSYPYACDCGACTGRAERVPIPTWSLVCFVIAIIGAVLVATDRGEEYGIFILVVMGGFGPLAGWMVRQQAAELRKGALYRVAEGIVLRNRSFLDDHPWLARVDVVRTALYPSDKELAVLRINGSMAEHLTELRNGDVWIARTSNTIYPPTDMQLVNQAQAWLADAYDLSPVLPPDLLVDYQAGEITDLAAAGGR